MPGGRRCSIIGTYDASGAATEDIVCLGDLPAATLQDGVAYFIMPDHLGAPHEIVNAANARVWFWDHDPFGNGTPTAAAGFSHDLRFPGQIYDAETRLHNNGFRDYSPSLGRYVESDPVGLAGGINTYVYAGNNPVSLIDPFGLDPEKCDRSCYRTAGSIVLGAGGGVIGALGGFAIGGGEGFGLSAVTGPGAIIGTAGGAIAGAGAGAYAGARWGVNAGAAVGDALYNLNWFSDSSGQNGGNSAALKSTLDRIKAGKSFPHRNDGSVFGNREGLLPPQAAGYYREYVHPTPGVNGPGPQRIVIGQGGEIFYTPDHYRTFIPVAP